jgi:UDP-N-acetylmuramate--alanine ligase
MSDLDRGPALGQSTEPGVVLPGLPARVHFVGIGGIGMSGLARILRAWGYEVSGSDATASPLTDELAAEGIGVAIGHTATAEAAAADLVVMTAAVRDGNPEVTAAREAGRPVVKRAALLGALADARRGIAVAGSHGKSTTSGMIATALLALGERPSYAVGATLSATGTNAAPGTGPDFVVEADEYDWSFLQLHPTVAVITNVDYDHPDLFPDSEAYDAAFARFVAGIRRDGALVLAADDPGCRRLLARSDWSPPSRVVTFGEEVGADWRLTRAADAWEVTGPAGRIVPLRPRQPGRHNARNATAALVALACLGIEPERAAVALETFAGVGRRFERKGEAAGVEVVDEYAHHPTEIAASLAAARERFPGRRLWALFQPHTFSRLKALLPAFAAAFADADEVVILDVYAARETDDLGVSAADLRALVPNARAAADPEVAAELVAGLAAPGDVVMTLGAGSVTETGPILLGLLEASPHPPIPSSDARERGKNPSGRSGPALAASAPQLQPEGRPPRPATHRAPLSRASGEGPGVRARSAEPIPGHPTLKLLRDSPMRLHTTWRVGGPADLLVRAATPDALRAAVRWGVAEGLPVTVLGGGSNLLVGDGGIRGLVVLARTPGERADGLVAVEDLAESVRLTVGAQAPLSWTGRYAAERGWSGLDWGVGLPGTVGGATVNNAGAHGVEQKDHLEGVALLDLETGEEEERPAAWLEPAYRHTRVKAAPRPRRWVVLAVTMQLPKGDAAELVRLAEEHAAFRKRTQPGGATGGSTFANPPGDHAGRLLEEAGLKGHCVGGAAFSPKHANWIVNDGTAIAADIRTLIATAKEQVAARFGIELRQEVEEIGEP